MIHVERISTAAGATEPVTADEFMVWARITDEAERATCERLITVARTEVEQYTGHVLVAGTFAITMRAAYAVELPLTPITSVDQVQGIDSLGVFTLLDPSAYVFVLSVTPAVLRVTDYNYSTGGYEVRVTAGHASDAVPAELKQTVLDVAALHYQHRDDPDLLERVRGYLSVINHQFGIVQV